MLKEKFVLSYFSQFISKFIGIIIGFMVARIVGPSVLGTIAFGMSFVAIFKFITDLGLDTTHIKFITEGKDIGKCNKTYSTLKLVLIAVFTIVVLAAYFFQTLILKKPFESDEHEIIIFICLAIYIFESVYSIPRTLFIAKTERATIEVPALIREIIIKLSRLILAFLGFGAIALVIPNLFTAITLTIFLLYWVKKKYSSSYFDKDLAKQYIKYSLPIILSIIVTSQAGNIDIILLQYFTNSNEVGLYTIGHSISQPIKIMGIAISGLFFPIFSELVATQKHERITHMINKYQRFLTVFIFPLCILAAIYAPVYIPFILGEKYLASIPVVSIIIISVYLYIYTLPYSNLIFAFGKFKVFTIMQSAFILILVSSIYLFSSPNFLNLGALGTAYAVFISNLVLYFIYIIYLKNLNLSLSIIRNKKTFITITAIGVCSYFIFNALHSDSYHLIIYSFPVIYLIILFCILFLIKGIKKQDIGELKEIAKIKNILTYTKNEFKLKKNDEKS